MSAFPKMTSVPLLALLLLAGCGPSAPATADPDKARDVLRAALDAWKQGDSLESLRERSPAIHANDPDWAAGARLERYEIKDGDGKLTGYDFSCPVTLFLRGGAKPRNVSYTVGTGRSLVVVREGGG